MDEASSRQFHFGSKHVSFLLNIYHFIYYLRSTGKANFGFAVGDQLRGFSFCGGGCLSTDFGTLRTEGPQAPALFGQLLYSLSWLPPPRRGTGEPGLSAVYQHALPVLVKSSPSLHFSKSEGERSPPPPPKGSVLLGRSREIPGALESHLPPLLSD